MSNTGGRVVAVLGPTNTGKTHFALERLLGHRSGMIGFPLRLLARENYDRLVAARGSGAVALITGEEMIVPPAPRYFVCTVEAMPLDRPVAFLAVDEIQLCADPERGHVFTDRLLHARGIEETLFLGAETIAPLIRRLVPRVEFITRPRFSALSWAGHKKLTRLPPRSAIVAFSAAEVYATAELVRRQRGGTAVVLGALSPRTRNAQVALYQAGEVDYLVATDAIGMGLNMDIDHVAFARLTKFDGRHPRRLNIHEIAQIAGRAGRHTADGTFGTTGDELSGEGRGLTPEQIEAIEGHEFEALKALYWRNHQLDYHSPRALLHSLEQRPPRAELMRTRDTDDHLTLAALAQDPEILALARHREAVLRLWEVCRIPDFRKVLSDAHTRLLGQVYRHLMSLGGVLPADWVAGLVARLDRTDGDIDTLVTRIAHVRTWTYISHRPDWLIDAGHWRERTREIEDKLSDALHQRLTQRFVDRRQAMLVKTLKGGGPLLAAVTRSGEVVVEGHGVGQLEGLHFIPDAEAQGDDGRALMSAARRALRDEIGARVRQLESAPAIDLTLEPDGVIRWQQHPVGRLSPGTTVLTPAVTPLHDDLLDQAQAARVRQRLERHAAEVIAERLAPLVRLAAPEQGTGSLESAQAGLVRGLAFQVVEGLGVVPKATVATLLAGLDRAGRQQLQRLGLRLGWSRVYLAPLLKPRAIELRALLWAVSARRLLPAPLPPPGRISFVVADAPWPAAYHEAIGYPVVGPRAIRLDLLDRFERELARLNHAGPVVPSPALAAIIGAREAELGAIFTGLGWRNKATADGVSGWRPPVRRVRPLPTPAAAVDPHSPFARLRQVAGG